MELPRTEPTELVLATDLHAGNVLRAERQPWLVIDPKPFVGDPAYDATQHLFNCSARLQSDPDATIRSLRTCLASITNVSGCGRSLAQRRSRATIGVTATGWHSLERLLRELRTRAKPLHSRLPREPTPCWSTIWKLDGRYSRSRSTGFNGVRADEEPRRELF